MALRIIREAVPAALIMIGVFGLLRNLLHGIFGEHFTPAMAMVTKNAMVTKIYSHYGFDKIFSNPANFDQWAPAYNKSGVPTLTYYNKDWSRLANWKDSDSLDAFVCSSFAKGTPQYIGPALSKAECAAASSTFKCGDDFWSRPFDANFTKDYKGWIDEYGVPFGNSAYTEGQTVNNEDGSLSRASNRVKCFVNKYVDSTQTCYTTCADSYDQPDWPILVDALGGFPAIHFLFVPGPLYVDLFMLLWFTFMSPRRFEIMDDVSFCFHLNDCYKQKINMVKRAVVLVLMTGVAVFLLFIIYPVVAKRYERRYNMDMGTDTSWATSGIQDNLSDIVILMVGVIQSLKDTQFAADYLVYAKFPKEEMFLTRTRSWWQEKTGKRAVNAIKSLIRLASPASHVVMTAATRVLDLTPELQHNSIPIDAVKGAPSEVIIENAPSEAISEVAPPDVPSI